MPTFCPTYHVPVLLRETVDGLDVKPDGVYVDVTFGGGGHSREILSRLGSEGRLFSFDQDADAEQNVPADESRLTFVRSNFRYLIHWMRYHGQMEGVDGILADLGVSSHHFDAEERGFSFRFDAPLDMRMNGRGGETAAQVLNTRSEDLPTLRRTEKWATAGSRHRGAPARAGFQCHRRPAASGQTDDAPRSGEEGFGPRVSSPAH